ncbi:hypothetical protein RN001_015064 [Aquatica leii]|uniref:Uncharacterized protein n=1 Tax=Aquatica leii TaxID=1421715 RepID=A0AAN7PZ18_9COLE|nr:hypothetical protein RN001_015064 [Aquatica leii]
MEKYIKYKVPLQNLRFPNINAFNDEEILELFLPKNRFLLLMWIVNTLNSEVEFLMESSESTETAIADYLYESGFCTSSQRLQFVQRLCSIEDDIQIFDRIFQYLDHLQEDVSADFFEKNNDSISVGDFLSKDINLFPMLQTVTVCTEAERKYELAKYEENIKQLKDLTNRNINLAHNKLNLEDSIFDDDVIAANTESFKEHVKNLNKSISAIKNTEVCEIENGFSKNCMSQLNKCDELQPVLEYYKSMNLMKRVADTVNEDNSNQDDEVVEIVKCCAENFVRVVKELED